MSDLKVDAITAANANTAITIKGAGTGKVKLGDGNLLFPDADGSANQLIKTDGSGYVAGHTEAQAGTQTTTSTSQFPIVTSFIAANNISGTVTLTLKDAANFTWVQTHSWNDAGDLGWGAGVKSLSAELTQLAIVTANTFDGSGSISITYM